MIICVSPFIHNRADVCPADRSLFARALPMSGRTANITSVEAVAWMQAAMVRFEAEVRDALVAFGLESRKPVEWIEQDRGHYWPRQVRLAQDAVNEAKINLERCQLTIRGDERRSCTDERKLLEKAKRRFEFCEAHLAATRRWMPEIHKEVEAFLVHLAKFDRYLDTEFAQSKRALANMSAALADYLHTIAPPAVGKLDAAGSSDPSGSMAVEPTHIAASTLNEPPVPVAPEALP